MKIALIISIVVAIASIGGNAYLMLETRDQQNQILNVNQELATLRDSTTKEIAKLTENLEDTSHELEITEEARARLKDDYEEEKERNDAFSDQIEKITGTVGILDKLSKTDKELLQKYSRIYFLNENYMPERLVEIDKDYIYDESKQHYIHANVESFFEDMVEDALDDDINLWVVSAFRSFDYQAEIKSSHLVNFGSGANAFSADQGYSEHQLGTTIDFTTNGLNGELQGFENTEAFEWMVDNAYKYGFILSYPPNNQFYVFEPWHWRFVGTELAKKLHNNDQYFYDLDQREIDKYLVSIFD